MKYILITMLFAFVFALGYRNTQQDIKIETLQEQVVALEKKQFSMGYKDMVLDSMILAVARDDYDQICEDILWVRSRP